MRTPVRSLSGSRSVLVIVIIFINLLLSKSTAQLYVDQSPVNAIVNLGINATFHCSSAASGDGTSGTILWFMNETLIHDLPSDYSALISAVSTQRTDGINGVNSTLTVLGSELTDGTQYKCGILDLATFSIVNSSTFVSLTVRINTDSIALFMFTPIIEPTINVQEGLSSRNNDHYRIIAIISVSTSVGVVLIIIIVSSLVIAAVCIINRKTKSCDCGKDLNTKMDPEMGVNDAYETANRSVVYDIIAAPVDHEGMEHNIVANKKTVLMTKNEAYESPGKNNIIGIS